MPSRPPLRVLGLQLETENATTAAARDRNTDKGAAAVRAHVGKGIRVFLLGELFTVGYSDDVMASLDVVAEAAGDGSRSFRAFAAAAKHTRAWVVYGYPRRRSPSEGGGFSISQCVIAPDGSHYGTYDKAHLCSFGDCAETSCFSRGSELLTFEVDGWRVGVLICYELRFPEIWRKLVRGRGCDVVLHPVAFPRDEAFASWHDFVVTRALENQAFVLSSSRAGSHFGDSICVPAWVEGKPGADTDLSGADAAPPHRRARKLDQREGALLMVCDDDELRAVREKYPLLQDVHPTLYHSEGREVPRAEKASAGAWLPWAVAAASLVLAGAVVLSRR